MIHSFHEFTSGPKLSLENGTPSRLKCVYDHKIIIVIVEDLITVLCIESLFLLFSMLRVLVVQKFKYAEP